jgi:hypothetical protein
MVVSIPVIFIACFFKLNPHYVDQWQQALHDVMGKIKQVSEAEGFPECMQRKLGLDHFGYAMWGLAGHGLARSIPCSLIAAAASLCGLVVALRRRLQAVWVAWGQAMIAVAGVASTNKVFLFRNHLVALPAIVLSLAIGVEWVGDWLVARWPRAPRALLRAVAIVALFGPMAVDTVASSVGNERLKVDARMRALDWIAAHASSTARVAFAPTVVGSARMGGEGEGAPPPMSAFERPRVRLVGEAADCSAIQRLDADYVVTASTSRDPVPPYHPAWPIAACPSYEEVASFEANPYEHTWWVSEMWLGRVDARVLARVGR